MSKESNATKLHLKRFSVLRFATVTAVISAAVAFIYGIILAITGVWALFALRNFALLGGSAAVRPGAAASIGLLFIIIAPIAGFISGFIGGAIFALLYNLVASRIGGFVVTVEEA